MTRNEWTCASQEGPCYPLNSQMNHQNTQENCVEEVDRQVSIRERCGSSVFHLCFWNMTELSSFVFIPLTPKCIVTQSLNPGDSSGRWRNWAVPQETVWGQQDLVLTVNRWPLEPMSEDEIKHGLSFFLFFLYSTHPPSFPLVLYPSESWSTLGRGQHFSSALPSITQPAALQGLPMYSVYSPVFQNKGSCVNSILRSPHQQGAESEFCPWLIWGKGPSVTANAV